MCVLASELAAECRPRLPDCPVQGATPSAPRGPVGPVFPAGPAQEGWEWGQGASSVANYTFEHKAAARVGAAVAAAGGSAGRSHEAEWRAFLAAGLLSTQLWDRWMEGRQRVQATSTGTATLVHASVRQRDGHGMRRSRRELPAGLPTCRAARSLYTLLPRGAGRTRHVALEGHAAASSAHRGITGRGGGACWGRDQVPSASVECRLLLPKRRCVGCLCKQCQGWA